MGTEVPSVSKKLVRLARQAALQPVLRDDDVRTTYVWLLRLARNPYADEDAPMAVAGRPRSCAAHAAWSAAVSDAAGSSMRRRVPERRVGTIGTPDGSRG